MDLTGVGVKGTINATGNTPLWMESEVDVEKGSPACRWRAVTKDLKASYRMRIVC
jgi:hypothetical protein